MRSFRHIVVVVIALLFLSSAAAADQPLQGMNIVNPQWRPVATWTKTIEQLKLHGVASIRVGLVAPYEKSKAFIVKAARAGLEVLVIIQINDKRALRAGAKVRPGHGRTWDLYPLSDVDIAQFETNLASDVKSLEAAGVRALGFEVGNEINWAPFNGDLSIDSEGIILGAGDLKSGPKAKYITASFDHYLRLVGAVKRVRDQSRLNKNTPIISAGLSDVRNPKWLRRKKFDYISIEATLEYLRQQGIDDLIDAYGIHEYSNHRKTWAEQRAKWWDKSLAICGLAGGKPCWITEWGISNLSPGCDVDDSLRVRLIGYTKTYLRALADQEKIARAFYFNWAMRPNPIGQSVFWQGIHRCGRLMPAGVELLRND
jgi:hypothetical protein